MTPGSAPLKVGNVAKKGEETRNWRHLTKSGVSDLLLKLPGRWFQNIDPKTVRAGKNPLLTSPMSVPQIREASGVGGLTQATQPARGSSRVPGIQFHLLSLKALWTQMYCAAHRNQVTGSLATNSIHPLPKTAPPTHVPRV